MIDDYDDRQQANAEAQRKALIEEENRIVRLRRVFGSGEGLDVLEWILQLSGYWVGEFHDERAIGRFELGRHIFNQVCMADLGIASAILDRRRKAAEAVRNAQKKKAERNDS